MVKHSITFHDLNLNEITQLNSLLHSLRSGPETSDQAAPSEAPKKRGRPAKTVSPDEDEDFGKKPLKKKDLKSDDEDESEEEDLDEEDEDESDDGDPEEEEDDSLSFDEVSDVINKYGGKDAKGMKEIYSGFNLKNTKELKANPKKWEPVYRKVMAKLKALKKA